MSKYKSLWEFAGKCVKSDLTLTFDEIERICGFKIDHSFLNYKDECSLYGCKVSKISLKNKTVTFSKTDFNG